MSGRRLGALLLVASLGVGVVAAAALSAPRKHRLKVPPRPAFPRALSVDETEYELNPSRFVVSSGRIRINAYNRGMDDHDLVIYDQAGTTLGATFLPPGEAGEIVVTLPAGDYRVVCSLFAGTPVSHEALGMKFTLTVQNPPAYQAALLRARPRSSAHVRTTPPTRQPWRRQAP